MAAAAAVFMPRAWHRLDANGWAVERRGVSCLARCGDPSTISDAPVPSAGELTLDTPIRCERLHATLVARVCIVRQLVTDRQRPKAATRSSSGRRCTVSEFPACDSRTCGPGRAIREALDPENGQTWRGSGPGGRFERGASGGQRNVAAQREARRRLRVVGLLDVPPSLDEPPEDEGEAAT
jgi:hypothetical protein